MAEFALPTMKAFAKLQQATAWLAQAGLKSPEEAGAAATDYLRLFALVALAYMWCRMAEIALEKKSGDQAQFYETKLACARFYMTRLLPEIEHVVHDVNLRQPNLNGAARRGVLGLNFRGIGQ